MVSPPGLLPKLDTVTREAACAAGAVVSDAAASPSTPTARVVAAARLRRRDIFIGGPPGRVHPTTLTRLSDCPREHAPRRRRRSGVEAFRKVSGRRSSGA